MTSVHAKCLAVSTEASRTLVCGRSKGHTASSIPERREHCDPSADEYWSDDKPAPNGAPSLAEQAALAIFDHVYRGDFGNAERVLNEYAADINSTEETPR